MTSRPFHLAIPVRDLAVMRGFYRDMLGCTEGRSAPSWVDLDLYGHQLVLHQVEHSPAAVAAGNMVDGQTVPLPHFGVVLEWQEWQQLAGRLREAGTDFVVEPGIRFAGEPGEQATLFFLDPEGNALEFKAFRDLRQLFAR